MKFFRELRRRNFGKVGVVYVLADWLARQIVGLVVENQPGTGARGRVEVIEASNWMAGLQNAASPDKPDEEPA